MALEVSVYQYGDPPWTPGLSVGVARHLPRGIRKADYHRLAYFDVWMPLLAPSAELVAAYRAGDLSFRIFASRYRTAMKTTEARQVIRLLAATARVVPVRLGCFCEDEQRCHRSILRQLVMGATSELPPPDAAGPALRLSSPPCSMPEIDG